MSTLQSMRIFALATSFPALLLLGNRELPAQTLIPPQSTVNSSSAKPRANEQLLLFQKGPDKDVAVFVDTLPAIGGQKNLRVEISGATFRSYSIREASMEPLVLFGSRLAFTRFRNNSNQLAWLDLANGTEKQFTLNFSPVSIAAASETLAALGYDASNQVHLALIEADGKARSLPFANPAKFNLRSTLFSMNAKGEAMLIDCTNATFTTLTIDQDQVRESAPVALSGPEFEYSRNRSLQVSGRLKMRIVLGHVSGSQSFLLGPYRARDGYRLVEVDEAGQQTNSYRLQVSGEGNSSLSPNPLVTTSTHIVLTAMDGTVRQYRRP